MPLIGNGLALIEKSPSPFENHSYYTSGYQAFKKKRKAPSMAKNKTLRKKQKKEKHSRNGVEEEPAIMSSGLSTPRTKDLPKDELPSLYKEDLGTAGVKMKSKGPILSGPQASFNIPVTSHEENRRKQRQMRFAGSITSEDATPDALSRGLSASRVPKTSSVGKRKASEIGDESGLVGTCQDLEKPYLRLTTFPKAEQVRPLEVLTKSLSHIKCRYIKTDDFEWANEQLKSVRQDLTVQGLKNDFVLEVYETHARILLEHGDLNEFNQCQTMIRTLTTGVTGSGSGSGNDSDMEVGRKVTPTSGMVLLKQSGEAADEFGGYRLLYAMVQNSSGDVTKELCNARRIVNQEEQRAARDTQRSPRTVSCRHAILVVKAVTHNDYHAFFRLYEAAPHLSAYLMDFLVKRVRLGAYKRIIAAYRPTISVEYFRGALCFQDLEETRQFLKQSGAVFVKENGEPPFWIDCKASK